MMNGKWKIISGGIITVAALFGIAFGVHGYLKKEYVPREVHDIQLAGFSQQMIQMQRNSQVSYWLNERNRWQGWVERYQYECAQDPSNARKAMLLQEAKTKRDEANREVLRLQQQ